MLYFRQKIVGTITDIQEKVSLSRTHTHTTETHIKAQPRTRTSPREPHT